MKYLDKRGVIRPTRGNCDRGCPIRQAVVIPALAEAQHLPSTLHSLQNNVPERILGNTLVLVVVNNRSLESAAEHSRSVLKTHIVENALMLSWLEGQRGHTPYHLAWIDASSPGKELPPWGGVGLARKIGCDSILALLLDSPTPVKLRDFVFFSLDADTLTSPDYLETAGNELRKRRCAGGVISFTHQRAESAEGQAAIDAYEAFLHYYVAGLRWAGSPYAFHTIGSCLCFTADGYARAGGFPARRQAGEDFYFCVELVKAGGICEINKTRVFPSARISQRVPFGTGRRMAEAVARGSSAFAVYDFRVFACLRKLLAAITTHRGEDTDRIYAKIENAAAIDFLEMRGFPVIWKRFHRQYKTIPAILSAFHRWFDGFVTLKFVHWLTEKEWPRVALKDIPEADAFQVE